MCGGGGSKPYDAYKKGDFQRWKAIFDKKSAIQQAAARGEISQADADQQIAALGDTSALENKIKSDASANMELREDIRQNEVGLGKIGIDKAFERFNPDYYAGYKNDYTSYYNPQLDRQYGEALDKMKASLAGRGALDSTVGGAQMADLARTNTEARTNIANEATDAANKLRSSVENEKTNLYNLNQASADPQAVNAQAVGQATALVAPPQYSPLGMVFANALNSINNFASSYNNRPTRSYTSPYSTPSGYGSGKVIS